MRGQLTRAAARNAAKAWRKATERYPKAVFNISFAGYDDDPRELNEFPDVCSYAKQRPASPAWMTPRLRTGGSETARAGSLRRSHPGDGAR